LIRLSLSSAVIDIGVSLNWWVTAQAGMSSSEALEHVP
jgi:hypothetical protein